MRETKLPIIGLNHDGHPVLQWDDATQTTVIVTTFGRGRIIIARYPDVYQNLDGSDGTSYTDGWCYSTCLSAVLNLQEWNPLETEEPVGWTKHISSQRRRVNGLSDYEYTTHEEEQIIRAKWALKRPTEAYPW